MYSSNPSYESLRSSEKFYQSSQVNPNLSTTNLQKLGMKNNLFEPVPRKAAYPITPPVSNVATPIKEEIRFFQDDNLKHNYKIITLCVNWYITSIISNYSTKMILQEFRYPITLTQCQFILNSVIGLILLHVLIRKPALVEKFPKGSFPDVKSLTLKEFVVPNEFILRTTIPMGLFQFVGHLTSHNATSIIPVSLNHTIKALSPITTVFIYRFFFKIKYELITYITLIPLMMGIMLSCYKANKPKVAKSDSNDSYELGLVYSFVSMLIFVSQNIFAKNRLTNKQDELPGNRRVEKKLDKLSILYYCSIIGFIFTWPIYLILEYNNEKISLLTLNAYSGSLILVNGVSHFMQSLLAFQILGLISPINYSIANILKRIIIILVAFLLEGKKLTYNQIFGILLTFIGLFAYDRFGMKKVKH